jgi:hypothetical protein
VAWLVGLDWLHWLCAVRLIWTCRGSHTYSLSWLALAIFTLLLARRPGAWLRLGIGLTVLIVGFDGAVWAMNRPLKLLAVGLIAALAPPVVPFLLAGLRDLARSLADYPARGGVRPHAAALLFVGGPVLLLGLLHRPTRPAPDGAPVVPTVVRMLVAGERDLTAYTTFRFGYWLHIRDTGLPHFVSRRPGGIYTQ